MLEPLDLEIMRTQMKELQAMYEQAQRDYQRYEEIENRLKNSSRESKDFIELLDQSRKNLKGYISRISDVPMELQLSPELVERVKISDKAYVQVRKLHMKRWEKLQSDIQFCEEMRRLTTVSMEQLEETMITMREGFGL